LSWLAGDAAGGSSRPRRLTESKLAQWPQRTVTVLNRLLHGTPTWTHRSTQNNNRHEKQNKLKRRKRKKETTK
jgi:hypothetical protein